RARAASLWTARMVDAIDVDFPSLHLYPENDHDGTDNLDVLEEPLRGAHVGAPVVIEEMWPHQIGTGPRYDRFLARSLGERVGVVSLHLGADPGRAGRQLRGRLEQGVAAALPRLHQPAGAGRPADACRPGGSPGVDHGADGVAARAARALRPVVHLQRAR